MMSEYFKIVPGAKPRRPSTNTQEIVRGDSWSVRMEDGEYLLDYVSGELAGKSKKLTMSKSETEALKIGEISIDEILIAHGAS